MTNRCYQCGKKLDARQIKCRQQFCSMRCHADRDKEEALRNFDKRTKKLDNGCIVWTTTKGRVCTKYGTVFAGMYAHRAAWERTYGKIPPGKFVLHRCDNPPCVNPKHLFLGTHDDNMADMQAKGRDRYGFSDGHTRGEQNINAKVTADDVRWMREWHAAGWPQFRVGAVFGLTQAASHLICSGKNWRHVR